MFTKMQPLLLIFVSMLAVFAAAFYFNRDGIAAQAEGTSLSYSQAGEQLERMRQQTAEVGETFRAIHGTADTAMKDLAATHAALSQMVQFARAEKADYSAQKQAVDAMVQISAQHANDTKDVLDKVLASILGDPIGQTFGDRAVIKVFSLKEAGYRGYMAKVKLHDPKAIKLVLSHDKVGDKGETTSQAAQRTGATLAINGGGFATQGGLLYPMGITVVDGKIVTYSRVDLSFIGFNDQGRLVGGAVTSKEQVKMLNVQQGATFVPTLLQDGKKQPIPKKWKNKKEPRTLIGHFSNGDILLIVIDGREYGYSTGITLEEAQDKLLEFNVRDAYNLDGGGSSTFYYNGKILNKPSDGRERKLASSFVLFQ